MRHAWREIVRRPSRFAGMIIAILISTAFLAASLVFTATATQSLSTRMIDKVARSDVIVHAGTDPAGRVRRTIAAIPGVEYVEPFYRTYVELGSLAGAGSLELNSLPDDRRLQWAGLTSGRWPRGAAEIALSPTAAAHLAVGQGDRLRLADSGTGNPRSVVVTGITDEPLPLLSGSVDAGIVAPAYFHRNRDATTFLILAAPNMAASPLAAAVAAALPVNTSVTTSTAEAQAAVTALTDGMQVLGMLLLASAGVSLLAGSIIIANVFATVLVQRRRQIGLLRAVGASARSVRRGLYAEALLLALPAVAAGIALGVGFGALASAVIGTLREGLVLPGAELVAVAVVGVAVTLVSAVLPVRRASREPPIVALQSVPDADSALRMSRLRLSVVGLAILGGAAVVALSLNLPQVHPFARVPVPLALAIAGSAMLAWAS